MFCFVLFCFVLFCFVLFCFVLFCFVLFCFVLLSYLHIFNTCLTIYGRYNRFREIKQWPGIMRQTYDRCLDLYLAPRRRKPIAKREWDYQKYLPELPKPKDLRYTFSSSLCLFFSTFYFLIPLSYQFSFIPSHICFPHSPFPTTESIQYKGHTQRIRSISMAPSGEYFVTGSEDHTVRVWEVSSGRSVAMWTFEAPVYLPFPSPLFSLLPVCSGSSIYLVLLS